MDSVHCPPATFNVCFEFLSNESSVGGKHQPAVSLECFVDISRKHGLESHYINLYRRWRRIWSDGSILMQFMTNWRWSSPILINLGNRLWLIAALLISVHITAWTDKNGRDRNAIDQEEFVISFSHSCATCQSASPKTLPQSPDKHPDEQCIGVCDTFPRTAEEEGIEEAAQEQEHQGQSTTLLHLILLVLVLEQWWECQFSRRPFP